MKSTGIVRKVDDLGRVSVPKELRRALGISEKDPVEFFVDSDQIILKKYRPNMQCAVTGEVSDDNHRLLDGELILSDAGAKQLFNQLRSKIDGW